jgi:hypothetical protein
VKASIAVLLALIVGPPTACRSKSPTSDESGAVFAPTSDRLLSTNSPTKDEDPSVLRARDGSIFVAWFSDRDAGNADIYIASTRGGTEWTPHARVTTSRDGDFYPNLLQDDQGLFHLVWFRWDAPFRGHIVHNTSTDGQRWDPASETLVTTIPDVDDWVPTIAQRADGTLLVYFVSARRDRSSTLNRIYVTSRSPGGAWTPASPLTIASATEHDHLPFALRTGAQMTLVWVRTDAAQPTPWTANKADVLMSSSADGLAWSTPLRVTKDTSAIVHVFPALYASADQSWLIMWLSTRLGAPRVFEIPLATADLYPQATAENTLLGSGYSHRVVATPTPRVYLGVWVQGPDGAQDIYYRYFRR